MCVCQKSAFMLELLYVLAGQCTYVIHKDLGNIFTHNVQCASDKNKKIWEQDVGLFLLSHAGTH